MASKASSVIARAHHGFERAASHATVIANGIAAHCSTCKTACVRFWSACSLEWLAATYVVIASWMHTTAIAKLSAVQAANAGFLSGWAGCALIKLRNRSTSGSTKNASMAPISSAAAASRQVKCPNREKSPCQTNSGAAAQTATQSAKKNTLYMRLSNTSSLQEIPVRATWISRRRRCSALELAKNCFAPDATAVMPHCVFKYDHHARKNFLAQLRQHMRIDEMKRLVTLTW